MLADFFKKHGAIPPYENTYIGDPPMPPGGERNTTSFHYACGNSGAIDLNYPAGIEKSIIDEIRPHLIKLGFHTLWQVENHFDHMHVDFQGSASPTGFGGAARRGRLADRLVPAGQARRLGRAVAGRPREPASSAAPAASRSARRTRRSRTPMCQVLDRFNVSAKVRLAAWETAIVESGVKIPPTNDGTSLGPFQQIAGAGWGTRGAAARPAPLGRGVRRAARRRSSTATPTPGALAQEVQRSAYPERYGQRAGQAAALNDKFCGCMTRAGSRVRLVACLALAGCGCGGGSERARRADRRPRPGTAPPGADAAAARLRGRGARGAGSAARSAVADSTYRVARRADDDGRQPRAAPRRPALEGWGSAQATGRGDVRTLICDPNCAQGTLQTRARDDRALGAEALRRASASTRARR